MDQQKRGIFKSEKINAFLSSKLFSYIVAAYIFVLFVFALAIMNRFFPFLDDTADIVSVSVDSLVLFVLLIISVGNILSEGDKTEEESVFEIATVFISLICFVDILCYLFEGTLSTGIGTKILETAYYVLLIPYFFVMTWFLCFMCKADRKTGKRIYISTIVSSVILMLLIIASWFVPILYEIDAEGNAHWTEYTDFTYLAILPRTIALLAGIIKSSVPKKQKIALTITAMLPATISVTGSVVNGYVLSYPLGYMGQIFAFIAINTNKSSYIASTEKDLEIARNIQIGRVTRDYSPDDFGRVEVYASMNTAKEVGGDFYDLYMLDEKRIVLLIADVSGKGIPAAMFMMRAITSLENFTKSGLELDEVMDRTNVQLSENNKTGEFVTVWEGILDLDSLELKYVDAAHGMPYIKHADGTVEHPVSTPNFMVGGRRRVKYDLKRMQLKPGDILFHCTDGVTEAHNMADELFGDKRLHDSLIKDASSVEKLCKNVLDDVNTFAGKRPQFDDITMISVRCPANPV